MPRSLTTLVAAISLFTLNLACIDPCGNDILERHSSPDNKWEAVLFQRSCGATTPYYQSVSLLRAGDSLPNDGANLFVADHDHADVYVRWITPTELEIAYPAEARVSSQVTELDGIRIHYTTFQTIPEKSH